MRKKDAVCTHAVASPIGQSNSHFTPIIPYQFKPNLGGLVRHDADSEYRRGLDLAWPLDRLRNTGGLAASVDEVKVLPHVAFTTLQDYLDDHPPVGSFYFGQDTAAGSFNGYNSWAEKYTTHRYWTRIECYRRIHTAATRALALFDDPALEEKARPLLDAFYRMRMQALSTTNFGMATPCLSIGRERAVASLMEKMDVGARRIKALMQSGARKHFRALPDAADDLAMTDGVYYLLGKSLPQAAAAPTAARSLKNAQVELRFGVLPDRRLNA